MFSSQSIPPPRFVFMEVNKRCNLRCTHCDFWQRDDSDRPNYLTLDQKAVILDDLASMNAHGHVVICGGEPMLDLEEYFGLAGLCRARGLRSLSVVNGTRIRSAVMAERLMTEGPDEISISLNSHVADIHDRTRGVPGAFEKAVRALRLLVEAKRRLGADTTIHVMGLIFGGNWHLIDGFYDFVLNDIGADQLKLNFLQPSFGQSGEIDPFFRDERHVDGAALARLIARCDAKYGLGLNPTWIQQVQMYFDSLAELPEDQAARGWGTGRGTRDHICNTYERNVMVNHYGFARLCFSDQFEGQQLAVAGDLRRFWEGAQGIRAKMRRCNQFCGISHSVRRESSTLKGRAKHDAHVARFGAMPPRSRAGEIMQGLMTLGR